MPMYDVQSRFLRKKTGKYIDPPGPVELPRDEAITLIQKRCVVEAKEKVTKRGPNRRKSS